MGWVSLLLALAMTHWTGAAAPQDWTRVLQSLDVIRGQAFVRDDPALLTMVYPAHSPLLAADRDTLAGYHRRDLRFTELRMRIVSARVLRQRYGAARLDVVDQLEASVVRLPTGVVRSLPRDRATRRVIELSHTAHGWRISAVRTR